jgi:nicotinamidase-related amidase
MKHSKYFLNKEDAVLLLIDLQEKLMPVISSQDTVSKNVNTLIKAAQIMEIPIVLTEQYPKGLGTTLREIKQNAEGFRYVEKVQFSAFVPELQQILTDINRKSILVTGIETHICVYQTVRDLIANGYSAHVVKDAVGSRTEANYLNGLQLMSEMGAIINNTETVLFDMLKSSADSNFKQISALVK